MHSGEVGTATARSFAWRLGGALRLAGAAFADVEGDRQALGQAAAVVIAAGIARGVASFAEEGWVGPVGSPLVAVAVWLAAGALIWGIGVRRFGYSSDYPELLRTIGFAAAPLLLLVFCALPIPFGTLLWVAAHAWAVLALAVAVREALDVDASRAIVVCLLALAVVLASFFVIGLLLVAGLG